MKIEIQGTDGENPVAIKTDSDGHLQADIVSGVEIGSIKASGAALTGNDNYILGYNSTLNLKYTGVGNGSYVYVYSDAVPAGYLYVITNMQARQTDWSCNIWCSVCDVGAVQYPIDIIAQTSVWEGVVFKIYHGLVLPAGYKMAVYFDSTQEMTDLLVSMFGYKIKIA